MPSVLVEAYKRYGLVIVGYRGRDTSIIEALEHVLCVPYECLGALYWVTSSKSRLLPAVKQLLRHATIAAINAVVVESRTFDELADDVIGQVKLPDCLQSHIDENAPKYRPLKPLSEQFSRGAQEQALKACVSRSLDFCRADFQAHQGVFNRWRRLGPASSQRSGLPA